MHRSPIPRTDRPNGAEGPKYELPGYYPFDLYVFRRKTLAGSTIGNREAFARLPRLSAGVERSDHHAGPLFWSAETGRRSESCLESSVRYFLSFRYGRKRTSYLRPCLFLADVESCGKRTFTEG